MSGASIEARLREELWPSSAGSSPFHVYAVLDGARDPRIHAAVAGSGLPMCCLYAGALPAELVEVAPWLVRLAADAPFTTELLQRGWGKSWGVFAIAAAPLEDVRRHLRRFLRVSDEQGKTLVFRYYDPRVMRVYLPTCNDAELRQLFGPIGLYLAEDADGDVLIRYHRTQEGGLAAERVRLAAGAAVGMSSSQEGESP